MLQSDLILSKNLLLLYYCISITVTLLFDISHNKLIVEEL